MGEETSVTLLVSAKSSQFDRKFTHPTCIRCPCWRWRHRNFAKMFSNVKTRMIGLPRAEESMIC